MYFYISSHKFLYKIPNFKWTFIQLHLWSLTAFTVIAALIPKNQMDFQGKESILTETQKL